MSSGQSYLGGCAGQGRKETELQVRGLVPDERLQRSLQLFLPVQCEFKLPIREAQKKEHTSAYSRDGFNSDVKLVSWWALMVVFKVCSRNFVVVPTTKLALLTGMARFIKIQAPTPPGGKSSILTSCYATIRLLRLVTTLRTA